MWPYRSQFRALKWCLEMDTKSAQELDQCCEIEGVSYLRNLQNPILGAQIYGSLTKIDINLLLFLMEIMLKKY